MGQLHDLPGEARLHFVPVKREFGYPGKHGGSEQTVLPRVIDGKEFSP
jgi:hypothetical protein